MKTFLSAFGGAMLGAVFGDMIVLQMSPVSRRSRTLEEMSPAWKASVEQELKEIEADFRPYKSPHKRAAELRTMLEEMLNGDVTEHEAKLIAQHMGAEIEVMAFDAEHTINDLRPSMYNEDSGVE